MYTEHFTEDANYSQSWEDLQTGIPPHDFDLSIVIAYKRYSGAFVVVLGEDEWRKGCRASLLGLASEVP